MPLPAGLNSFTLTFGDYNKADASERSFAGMKGILSVSPPIVATTSGSVLIEQVEFYIGNDGTASVASLVPNDDPGINQGTAYTVAFQALSSKPAPQSKTFVVRVADGATVDYDKLTAVTGTVAVPPPGVNSVVGLTGAVTGSQIAADATLRAALVPFWTAAEAVTSSTVRVAPDGTTIKSKSSRTTRSTYDATEAGNWNTVAGAGPAPGYETVQALGNITGTATIGLTGTYVTATLTGNTTLTFPSPTTGQAYTFELEATQDATGGRVLTFPAAVVWPGGAAPNMPTTAGTTAVYVFTSRDGGTTWAGSPQSLPALASGAAETVNTVAASGTAQTIPDPTSATINRITLTGNCTLTFPSAAAGKSFTVVLVQDGTGSRTVTWPGSVVWVGTGGTAPTLSTSAGKRDLFTFLCADGSTWLGTYAGAA